MAMTACKECGSAVSTKANTCPSCGAPLTTPPRATRGTFSVLWTAAKLLVGLILLMIVFRCTTMMQETATAGDERNLLVGQTTPSSAPVSCSVSDISIKSFKARFVSECSARRPCYGMKGVAVLANSCAMPVGVQLKITGYDKGGAPVASRDLWPASTGNIPPGEYTFSLDTWLDYDPDIKTFDLTPIAVKHRR